ncbi:MAG: uroporphyrinogen-III synthase, partial [Myxococcales bacterium]|nr:uroporphyrinogen-III synthase [Myxococcales bacterium]
SLHQLGIRADLVAKEYVGEAFARDLLDRGVGERSRVLLLRALEAREALPDVLAAAGAKVDVVPAYQTLKLSETEQVELRAALGVDGSGARGVDVALFTSSSTAHSFADALGDAVLPAGVVLASIGPVTSATLRERGLRVDVEAERYTVDGLLDALEAFFLARRAASQS